MGLMAYQEIKELEPAPELATLPGVKRKGEVTRETRDWYRDPRKIAVLVSELSLRFRSRIGTLLVAGGATCLAAGCRACRRARSSMKCGSRGLREVDDKPLLEGLSTSETPLLFRMIPGVLEYTTYDANVLARDLERIERYLRAGLLRRQGSGRRA